jgi:hypothetical protein
MTLSISLTVNGGRRDILLEDPRVTLLDLLRERLHLRTPATISESRLVGGAANRLGRIPGRRERV